MYNKPFGSIFGELKTSVRGQNLGFLSANDDPKAVLSKEEAEAKAAPKAAEAPAPAQETDPVAEIRARIQAEEKAKIFHPGVTKRDSPDELFTKTLPQFKAKTEFVDKNPFVQLYETKGTAAQEQLKARIFRRKLDEAQRKLKAANIYKELLGQYAKLAPAEKKKINAWIKKNAPAIKKLQKAQELKDLTSSAKDQAATLELEIQEKEKLLELRKEGINIQGKPKLKWYQPTSRVVRDSAIGTDPNAKIPKFKGKMPTDYVGQLLMKGAEEVQPGLGEEQAATAPNNKLPQATEKDKIVSEIPQKETDNYINKFIASLPDRRYYMKKRMEDTKVRRARKETQEELFDKFQASQQLDIYKNKLEEITSQYKGLQAELRQVVAALSLNKQMEEDISVLSILAEARPERFMSAPTLLDAMNDAFKRLSVMEGNEATQPTPEAEATVAVKHAAMESQAALNELQTRQQTLIKLESQIQGKPLAAPPPVAAVQLKKKLVEVNDIVNPPKPKNRVIPFLLFALVILLFLHSMRKREPE